MYSNNLIVIENKQIKNFRLDDKTKWVIGRSGKENVPDIVLFLPTISREHGVFNNMDGTWFYTDNNSKNGTFLNGKCIKSENSRRKKPVMLKDGDVLVFGSGDKARVCTGTVWAMFITENITGAWHEIDTEDCESLVVSDAVNTLVYREPQRGTAYRLPEGIAIYMGDRTYSIGQIKVTTG